MRAALFIAEAGLMLWLCWWLEPYRRPFFCLLILVMLCACGAYHLPRSASEFQASAIVQSIAMFLAVGEGVMLAVGRKRRRVLSVLFCAGFGILFVIPEQDLNKTFGLFVTFHTIALIFQLGVVVGALLVFWQRHLAWMVALAAIKPTAALSYWFLSDYATWKTINDSVMLATAILMMAWILLVPTSEIEPRFPSTATVARRKK